MTVNKVYIAGNWKMNLHREESVELLKGLREGKIPSQVEAILCPPFLRLEGAAELLEGSPYKLGAQDVSKYENGAHTGEISASMLKDLGLSYVIVGHSELRGEGQTDEEVSQKVRAALREGLVPIVCLGESEEEYDRGLSLETVARQLEESVLSLSPEEAEKVILAYEPLWAIGTGKNCPPEVAQEVAAHLKGKLKVPVLYGGSVKGNNAGEYLSCQDIDGVLVGGASLKAEEFLTIVEAAL
ncbi:MAG: triose-phosphate isomerase [Tissierellia bacterium]|nr:triose-phosphate isomerase [Tissierellia bacterium]